MTAQIAYRVIEQEQAAAALAEVWERIGTDPASAWLENPLRVDGLCLRDADVTSDETQQLLAEWPQGRIFGEGGDLQWEWLDDKRMHLVLISDRGIPPGYEGCMSLEPDTEEHLFLWGQYEREAWREDRIPTLPYPSTWQGPYAMLRVQGYEHMADRARPYDSRIVRYVGYVGNHSGTSNR